MFNHHDDAAMRGIEQARQLLEQQQYELQRRMADLHLRLQELQSFAPTKSIPRDVADQIDALPKSLMYSLREAREELDHAERVLNELLNTVLSLEPRRDPIRNGLPLARCLIAICMSLLTVKAF